MSGDAISLPQGYRLKYFDELDSTNAEALRLATSGEPGGLWIQAGSQLRGRGRLGRSWDTLSGNLFCSLLLRPSSPPDAVPQLGFVAGIALHDAIRSHAGDTSQALLKLKWPNDLLINARKAGGILLESHIQQDGKIAVVAGIGLNVQNHPVTTGLEATSLENEGIPATANSALDCLAKAFSAWYQDWNNSAGFPSIREAWLNRALDVGTLMSVKQPNGTIKGSFSGLDKHGALILLTKTGEKKHITAGDVFPL